MSEPISPPPLTDPQLDDLPAYVSNGLVGLRLGRIPLIEGLAVLNGLAAVHSVDQIEGFSRAPYPVAGDISLNQSRLSQYRERARFVEQRYDFGTGEFLSRFAYEISGARADIELVVFCSRTQPTLVMHEVRVTVNDDCELGMSVGLDPDDVPGRWLNRETTTPGTDTPTVDGSLLWECYGGLSSCGGAYVSHCDGRARAERTIEHHDKLAPLRTTYTVRASAGSTHFVRTIASLVPDQMHMEPHREASRLAAIGARLGFEYLRNKNRDSWRELWQSRIRLVGAGRRWQSLADAAFYYLHCSAHPSSLFSTSMFGLAYWPNYHYYRGQVMWDIESFVFPTLSLTEPHAAEALLQYRSDRTRGARRNAALNGYRGLQFPWASGPRHGEEMIRTSAPLVPLEQHVSLSVAMAFADHVYVTRDTDFLAERAWPILKGVAEWLESRVERTPRGAEIRRILGIAEDRDEPVDNDAYINLMAKRVLAEAAAAARRLARPDGRRWEQLADEIFVPRQANIILNHDRFTAAEGGIAGATPETLAAIFPGNSPLDPETERATIEFYLGRVEPYIGRPMLSALLGVHAAWIGDRRRSAELFEVGYAEFINEPFTETDEFSRIRYPDNPRVGPFQANLGGFLTSCLRGLPGLQPGPDAPAAWARRPVTLPEGWNAIECDRLWIRGQPVSLRAIEGAERAELATAAD